MSQAHWNTSDESNTKEFDDKSKANPNLSFASIVSDSNSFPHSGQPTNRVDAHLGNLSITGMDTKGQLPAPEASESLTRTHAEEVAKDTASQVRSLQPTRAMEINSTLQQIDHIVTIWKAQGESTHGNSGRSNRGLSGEVSEVQVGGTSEDGSGARFSDNWGLPAPSDYNRPGGNAALSNVQRYIKKAEFNDLA
jgi:hypothetical protein